MASDILHIKDSYYFEVPKTLWPSRRKEHDDFPDWWIRLDDDFQLWEAHRIYDSLQDVVKERSVEMPEWADLKAEYVHWKEASHSNHAKPFASFLESEHGGEDQWFGKLRLTEGDSAKEWTNIQATAGAIDDYHGNWAEQTIGGWNKLEAYNYHLSGKVIIPQVFGGELRNLYQPQSGICVSKFMIIQLLVAVIIVVGFNWLAKRVVPGAAPRGRLWNFMEAILVFFREQVVRPAIGHDADKFVPLLWTFFLFVLGCNLMGMIPWMGAPTGAFGVTAGLAAVTLLTGVVCGMKKFGPVGFFLNQVPSMSLPAILSPLKVMIFVIELISLLIKHAVLAIRLLANMMAGHVVLLGIMGLAFGAHAAVSFEGAPTWQWALTAVIAVVGSTLFSCLELFVAFLQAYVFTFLSALFIGAAIHHH